VPHAGDRPRAADAQTCELAIRSNGAVPVRCGVPHSELRRRGSACRYEQNQDVRRNNLHSQEHPNQLGGFLPMEEQHPAMLTEQALLQSVTWLPAGF